MALKLTNCSFGLIRKTEPINAPKPPCTISQLKSFMRSIDSLHKYSPTLAETSILSTKNDHNWTPECQEPFEKLKRQVAKIVELKKFDVHKDIRVVCNASHNGLGAVLEQIGTEGWQPISFASSCLNDADKGTP